MEVKAEAKYQRISPTKLKRILSLLRGKPALGALRQLEFMPHSAAKYVFEVLKSAIANAKHNYKLKEEELIISRAFAGRSTPYVRYRPLARGRTGIIKKMTSHITVWVSTGLMKEEEE